MYPGESEVYAYDFKNDPAIVNGDTIASIISVDITAVTPGATLPTLGSPGASGTQVEVEITEGIGVVAPTSFLVTFTILTGNGYTRVGYGRLDVVGNF
jgi:hypothetical protein